MGAQEQLTSEKWQEDLRFLQRTVHEKYPFLFKKITAKAFDEKVEEFYVAIPNMQAHEVVVGFSRIIASFKYGHTRMGYSESPVPFHHIPIDFYEFKDGLFIKSAHKDHGTIVGAKIVAIEGVKISKALQLVAPTVPLENEQFYKGYGLNHLTFPEVLHAQGVTDSLLDRFTLTLEKDGIQFDYSIPSTTKPDAPMKYGELITGTDWVDGRDRSFTPYYLKNFDKIYYFEFLSKEKTVYVRHSRIRNDKNEKVEDFYNRVFKFIEVNDVEKFVIDVRLNGGGNNFLNKPIITGIIANTKINQPGRFFVITGRRTFSAAQSLINELDNYTNVLFVGEPSSENINFYGDNKRVILPKSGLPVYLSFAWWQDKPQWENADFIKPHYPVELTYNDYVTNQDPVLKTILDFYPTNFTMEPLVYLNQLFEEGKSKKAITAAQRMAKDYAYSFIDFEREISNKAFILLGNDNERALFFFELATEVFQISQNTWANLGQAQWETGNFEGAKNSFKKVLNLSNDGSAADVKARRMLQKIEAKEKK